MDNARYVALVDDLRAFDTEVPWLEFKENDATPEKIGKLISAISNVARILDRTHGYVVWGIEDAAHEVVGTTFRPARERSGGEQLEFWLSKMISPQINFQFLEISHLRGRVVLLEIPAAMRVPTKFKGTAFIRIGDATPPLAEYPEREEVLIEKLRPFVWEAGVADAFLTGNDVIEALDYESYHRLTGQLPAADQSQLLQVMQQDGLIQPDAGKRWKILNLGAILFARKLDQFPSLARKAIRLVHYNGDDKTTTALRQVEGNKGYASGFEGLIFSLNRELPHNEEIRTALRVQKPVYPEIAVRELIANALLHQDFTIKGTGPLIEIFNRRLEITNPGAPLGEVSRLTDLPPRSRNEGVGRLMRRMKMCEELGSGLRRVISNLEMFQLPPLQLRTEGSSTNARMFAPKKFGDMEPSERTLACYQHSVIRFFADKKMTNASLRTRLGIKPQNSAQVSRIIRDAVEAGLIKPSEGWNSRSGHYLPFWVPTPDS
jgi:predicted HTH transcriptional regulator